MQCYLLCPNFFNLLQSLLLFNYLFSLEIASCLGGKCGIIRVSLVGHISTQKINQKQHFPHSQFVEIKYISSLETREGPSGNESQVWPVHNQLKIPRFVLG